MTKNTIQVKMFWDPNQGELERQVNAFLTTITSKRVNKLTFWSNELPGTESGYIESVHYAVVEYEVYRRPEED